MRFVQSLKAEREIMDDQQIRHSNDFDGMVLNRTFLVNFSDCELFFECRRLAEQICEGQVQRDGFLHFRAGALQEAHQRRRVQSGNKMQQLCTDLQ